MLADGTRGAGGLLQMLLYAGLGASHEDLTAPATGGRACFPELFESFVAPVPAGVAGSPPPARRPHPGVARRGLREVRAAGARGRGQKELGVIATELGRPLEALAHFDAAEREYGRGHRAVALGFALQCSGEAARHAGRHRDAALRLEHALALGREHAEVRLQGYCHLDLALVHLDLGAWAAARAALDDAEACLVAARHTAKLAAVELARARLDRLDGLVAAAWSRAVRLASAGHSDADHGARIAVEQAALAAQTGRTSRARAAAGAALAAGRARTRAFAETVVVRISGHGAEANVETWRAVGDPFHARRARLAEAADTDALLRLLEEAWEDPRLEIRVLTRLAWAAPPAEGAAYAEAAVEAAAARGSAWERAAAAEARALAAGTDPAIRAASEAWLALGAAPRAAGCLRRLRAPTPGEAELAAFFGAAAAASLLRPWVSPALAQAVSRHEPLLRLPVAPRPLVDRALAALPEPDRQDLLSLALVHVGELLGAP